MKKKLIVSLIVATLACLSFVLYTLNSENEANLELKTALVERGDISEVITATGKLEALVTVEVGTQVSGVIEGLFVNFNSEVKKGQLLAQLDETSLQASLEKSRAQVENAKAGVEYNKANYDRYKALYEKELIAKSEYDLVKYNYQNALSQLKNAKFELDRNQINLDYASIYSPIDGVILDRAVDEGQTVAASFNTPTLFTIANDLTQMQVETNVDEADIGKLEMGQRVEFTVDAYPDMKFTGMVSEIRMQPVETSNVVTYTVIIDAPNPEKKLMPGMTASVSFYVMEKNNIVLLPAKALAFRPMPDVMEQIKEMYPEISFDRPKPPTERGDGERKEMATANAMPPSGFDEGKGESPQMVWIKKDNTIKPYPVILGDTDELYYEVISGVNEGDEVLLSFGVDKSTSISTTKKVEAAQSPFMPQRPGGGGGPR